MNLLAKKRQRERERARWREKTEETMRRWREFHLFLAIFVGGLLARCYYLLFPNPYWLHYIF